MNGLPQPATFESHAAIAFVGKFATAAVMRPGVGFQVDGDDSFVAFDIRDTAGGRVVVSVAAGGVPALIAALQDAVRGDR